MATDVNPDRVLDCKGLICPMPIVKTAKAVKELQVGQSLLMIADDPGAKPDIEAWAKQTGHALLDVQKDGAAYQFWIRRTH
jgi:tRNA 2-thiouridine synthesizing protein A